MKIALIILIACGSFAFAQGENATQAFDVKNPSEETSTKTDHATTSAPETEVRAQAPLLDRAPTKNKFGVGVLLSPTQDMKFEMDGFLNGKFKADGNAVGIEGVFFTPISGVLGAKISLAYLHANLDSDASPGLRSVSVKTDKLILKGSGLLFATEQLFFELGANINTTNIDFPGADRLEADSGYIGLGLQVGANYVFAKSALVSLNYTYTTSTKSDVRIIEVNSGTSGKVDYTVKQSGFLGSVSYLF